MSFSRILIASLSMMLTACSMDASAEESATGASTNGGLSSVTRVIHVVNLDDGGPGSLRAAVEAKGYRVVVFDVGGRIDLKKDLVVRQPNLTIAGQTAPSPGISLWGAALRIRTHDVVVQHIAVRVGPGPNAKANDNRDAISIDGNSKNQSFEVLLENVSATWSVDEAVSTWYPTTRNVTITNSIVAEALRNAGHPKGEHSMGLLVGQDTQSVEITGNLLANNMFRNPVIGKGASAYVANNYVVNPGINAIHFYGKGGENAQTRASVINNFIEPGPSSQKTMFGVLIPGNKGEPTDDLIYLSGNEMSDSPKSKPLGMAKGLALLQSPPIEPPHWKLMPTEKVKDWVLAHAGPRPSDRDPVDARLIKQIKAGTEQVIDRPEDAGPLPTIPSSAKVANVPDDPLEVSPKTGKSRLEMWLCLRHLQVGGAPSGRCPEPISVLQSVLGTAN